MIDNIAKKLNLKLYETPVGFKYISDLMVNERIIAGGEEAGGMGVQNYIPERDGNLAGLLLLEMMVYQKKNIEMILQDMEKEFGRYYYQRCDLLLGEGVFDVERIRALKSLLGKKIVDVIVDLISKRERKDLIQRIYEDFHILEKLINNFRKRS